MQVFLFKKYDNALISNTLTEMEIPTLKKRVY